jgi:ribonuclease P protein component
MKPCASLKNAQDFTRVFRHGKALRGVFLRVHLAKRIDPPSHIGIVVTKKAGNAVARNLIRRRIRHILIDIVRGAARPADIVVYVDKPIDDVLFSDIKADLEGLLLREVNGGNE